MIDKYPRIANDDSQLTQFKNDVIAGEYGGSSVELDGNSLVIPEQEGPQPVITIDGVGYFHQIDTAQLDPSNQYYDMEGNPLSEQPSSYPYIYHKNLGGAYVWVVISSGFSGSGRRQSVCISDSSSYGNPIHDGAVTIQFGITDDTLSSEYFVNAYVQPNSDGINGTFYFTLVSDSEAPEYIDTIKQGNAVIPLKDSRIPDSVDADIGKVVKVGANGSYELGEAGGDNRIRIPSSIGNNSSLQDIIDLNIGITMPNPYSYKSYDVFFEGSFYYDNNKYYISNKPATLIINYYGSASISIIFDDQWNVNKVVQHSAVATGENTVLSAYTDRLVKNLIGVPDAAATDAGKIVKVAGAGSYELAEAGIPVPTPQVADAGKAIKVNTQGIYELGNVVDDNGFIFDLTNKAEATFNDLLGLIGSDGFYPIALTIKYLYNGNETWRRGLLFYKNNGSSKDLSFIEYNGHSYDGTDPYKFNIYRIHTNNYSLAIGAWFSDTYKFECIAVPALPSDASSKTYVLKSVNGTIRWVEETA